MALSLHDISITPFIRALTNLSAILKKGQSHADANSLPYSTLLEARLAPDMYPLPYQIQRVSDTAKSVAVRVAGIDPIPMPDNETTFEELQARIQKTIDILKGVSKESMEGKEGMEVVMKGGGGEFKWTAGSFLTEYAVPNLYFHVSIAYAILRMKGVPVGKMDYLMGGQSLLDKK